MHMGNKTELVERLTNNQESFTFSLYPPLPSKNLLIEVTNACNFQCIFCANRKMTRKKGSIKKELLKKILIEAFEQGVKEVGFYTTGEPLLYPHLEEAIAFAKKIGFQYIYLTTNGYLATEDRVGRLVDCGLDSLKFSINAIEKNAYKFIHGEDAFDKVMQNLKNICALREEKGHHFKLFVSYIMTRFTQADPEKIKDTFSPFCDEVVVLMAINQSGLTPEIKDLLSVNGGKMDFQFPLTLPCSMPFNTINVTYEGYLTACCADFQNYLVYADLKEVSLKDAWHNKEVTELRKMHLEKNVNGFLCNNCIYNLKVLPLPLRPELAKMFKEEEMFDIKTSQNRIKQYVDKNEKEASL